MTTDRDLQLVMARRFGVTGHEAWRKDQSRRRHRRVARRLVWPVCVLTVIVLVLARLGWI